MITAFLKKLYTNNLNLLKAFPPDPFCFSTLKAVR